MADLNNLAKSMNFIAETVAKRAVEVVKDVANKVGPTVVYATPVDTSRARMNWQGSVANPSTKVLAAYPDAPASPAEGPAIAIASIRAATGSYTGQKGGIWIVNNLSYIQKLNDGSSGQAPANFVAQAVLAGIQSVQTAKLLP